MEQPSQPDAPLPARLVFGLHLTWLAVLPALAVAASWYLLGDGESAWLWMLVPTLVYVGLLVQAYELKLSPLSFALVLLVPLQVGASAYLYGHSMAVFLVELCLIEIGAVSLGICIGTLRVHRPSWDASEIGGFLVVVIVCLSIVAGPILALYPSLIIGYEGASMGAVVLFLTAFATACLRHGRSLWEQAGQFRNTGQVAKVDFTVGTGRRKVGPIKNFERIWLAFMGVYVVLPWVAAYFFAS